MTWTDATTPLDSGEALGGCWASDREEFLGVGKDAGLTAAIIKSANGIDWDAQASPLDGGLARGVVRKLGHTVAGPLMKADASVADAYATIDLGADQSEVWVTYKVVFDGTALRLWRGSSSSGYFANLDEPGWGSYVQTGKWDSGAFPATPNTEHLVEMHFLEGVEFKVYVDEVLVDDESDVGDTTPVRNIEFGQIFAYVAEGAVAYIKDAKVGTTRGGNELFDANISSGNLDAFTSTTGDISVVSDFVDPSLYVAVGLSGDTADAIITSPDGDTWTGRGNPFLSIGSVVGTAVRTSDGALLVVGSNNAADQLAISLDDGANWTRYQPLNFGDTAYCVAVRQDDGLIVVGGGFSGVGAAVSSDGGTTWTQTAPFGASGGVTACAVRESDGAIVVVGINGTTNELQVAISTDDGATWAGVTNPFALSVATNTGPGVVVRSSDDAIIVAGCDALGDGSLQVAISTDSGTSWSTSSPFGATGVARCVALRPSDEAIVVGGLNYSTQDTVAISTDSGASWATYNLTAQNLGYGASLAIRSDDAIFVYGQELVMTADGGTTWNDLGKPPIPSGLDMGISIRESDDAILVGAGFPPWNPHAGVSPDGGGTWLTSSPFSVLAGSGLRVACKASGRVLVGSSGVGANGDIAYSDDTLVWTCVHSGLAGSTVGIDHSPLEDLWIAASDANDAASSNDDGATWTFVTHPMTQINGVYRDETNGRWWLVGQTTSNFSAAYSEDSGATWTEVSTPLDPVAGVGQANAIINCGGTTLALGGIDATDRFQMCVSSDAGSTWTLDGANPSPLGSGAVGGLAYSPTIPLAVAFGAPVSPVLSARFSWETGGG